MRPSRTASNSIIVGGNRGSAPDMPCGALLKSDGGTENGVLFAICGLLTANSNGAMKLPAKAACEVCPRSCISVSHSVGERLAARMMSGAKSGPWRVSSTGAGSAA